MKKILNILFLFFLISFVLYGAYTFGNELNKDIQNKTEINKLQKEKLILDIKLKKILLDSLNNISK
jgi:hypothetical protein